MCSSPSLWIARLPFCDPFYSAKLIHHILSRCHAVSKLMWELKEHENVIKYCSEIDSMHKVGVPRSSLRLSAMCVCLCVGGWAPSAMCVCEKEWVGGSKRHVCVREMGFVGPKRHGACCMLGMGKGTITHCEGIAKNDQRPHSRAGCWRKLRAERWWYHTLSHYDY